MDRFDMKNVISLIILKAKGHSSRSSHWLQLVH